MMLLSFRLFSSPVSQFLIFITGSVLVQAEEAHPRIPAGLNKKYSIVRSKSQSISAAYSIDISAPRLIAREWLLFAASPINHPGQKVISVKSTPPSQVIHDRNSKHRPLLRARVPVSGDKARQGIKFKIQIMADLYSRHLVRAKGKSAEVKLSVDERKEALKKTKLFDYTSPILQQWMKQKKLNRKPREGEIDYSRRVFQQIVGQSTYEYLGKQNRQASHVCASRKSDCGGLAILFASVLRSQGIPARILVGRWAVSAKEGEKIGDIAYYQGHVKAEFFAQGVGWVPVDLSSAVLHDKTRAKLRFFGHDSGDFITLHLDSGLSYDSIFFGIKTMDFLQMPAYWATGAGDFNGSSVKQSWKVVKQAQKR